MLNKPSYEQQKIINKIKRKKNVIINAVAGSGKTTTILNIAKQLTNKRILLLTYNRKLSDETKLKIQNLNLNNIDINTFHGFATKLNRSPIDNDILLKQFVNNFNFNSYGNKYDIVCLDEMQDCTENIFKLIKRTFYTVRKNITWLIIGDVRQTIYQYNGSDHRYLTLFHKLMKIKCKKMRLVTNYRCARNICYFWNKYCKSNKDKKLKSSNNSKLKVNYISLKNSYDCHKIIQIILDLKKKFNYKDDDFFILSYSVKQSKDNNKQQKPIHILFSECRKYKLNVYCPTNDNHEINDEETKNKIVFSSFHQAKGRERKVVFILGFDNTIYKFYKYEENINYCINEIYVAITRAKEHLFLIEGGDQEKTERFAFNFINKKKLKTDKKVNFIEEKERDFQKFYLLNDRVYKIDTSVTELVNNISPKTWENISKDINDVKIIDSENKIKKINITNIYRNNRLNLVENVSNINSYALITKFLKDEYNITNIFSDDKTINEFIKEDQNYEKNYNEIINTYKFKNELQKIMFNINFILSILEKRVYLTRQIDEYNWLDNFKSFDQVYSNLRNIISNKNIELEEEISINNSNNIKLKDWVNNNFQEFKISKFRILGRIDVIQNQTMIELKCVNKIKNEYILQTILYIWLNNFENKYNFKKYILFNILSNEKIEIKNDKEKINNIVKNIILNKISSNNTYISNIKFIKNNKS